MDSDDDFFGDDSDDKCISSDNATTKKVSSKLYNDGYRIGKSKEEEVQMQLGFDDGFQRGIVTGRACGELYAACRILSSKLINSGVDINGQNKTIEDIEKLLFEGVADNEFVDDETMVSLKLLVMSLSTDLDSAFMVFSGKVSSKIHEEIC
jgi:hypothetical protein